MNLKKICWNETAKKIAKGAAGFFGVGEKREF